VNDTHGQPAQRGAVPTVRLVPPGAASQGAVAAGQAGRGARIVSPNPRAARAAGAPPFNTESSASGALRAAYRNVSPLVVSTTSSSPS